MTEDNGSNWGVLEQNVLKCENKLCNVMVGNGSDCIERKRMDHNRKVLIWSMTGYDESNFDVLEWNLLQLGNAQCNVIGVEK